MPYPNGRSPFFTAFIFWKLVEGKVMVLMIYNITLAQLKFPGGSCKNPDKKPLDTGFREVREEVFEDEIADVEKIAAANPKIGAEIEADPNHTKYFYFVKWDDAFGKIRTQNKVEKDERQHDERMRRTQTEIIAPPHWEELNYALFRAFAPHQKALEQATPVMCSEPEIRRYVEDNCPQLAA